MLGKVHDSASDRGRSLVAVKTNAAIMQPPRAMTGKASRGELLRESFPRMLRLLNSQDTEDLRWHFLGRQLVIHSTTFLGEQPATTGYSKH
jgi:hypothetical protein